MKGNEKKLVQKGMMQNQTQQGECFPKNLQIINIESHTPLKTMVDNSRSFLFFQMPTTLTELCIAVKNEQVFVVQKFFPLKEKLIYLRNLLLHAVTDGLFECV